MFFSLLFFLAFCLIQTNANCPNGSVQSYTDSSVCYYFQKNKTDFMDAEGICRGFNGHLISIHDMFENVFLGEKANTLISDSASTDFWSGATNLLTSGIWSWMDRTPFDFSDWEKGQPQNITNCGTVRFAGEKWASDDCDKQKPYVCGTKASAPPTTTSVIPTTSIKPKSCYETWTFYNQTGFCYRVFINSTWAAAEDRCKIDGAHLASIHSSEEDFFITDLAYYPGIGDGDDFSDAWMGLYTEDNNTSWKWTDCTSFDYTNWVPGEPNNPGVENCGQILLSSRHGFKAGQFNNLPCDKVVARFVCKYLPQ